MLLPRWSRFVLRSTQHPHRGKTTEQRQHLLICNPLWGLGVMRLVPMRRLRLRRKYRRARRPTACETYNAMGSFLPSPAVLKDCIYIKNFRMEIFTLIPLLRIACVEKRGVWRLKSWLFELASASEFRLFRLQTTVFQRAYSHAAKLFFFATFFCSSKRKLIKMSAWSFYDFPIKRKVTEK